MSYSPTRPDKYSRRPIGPQQRYTSRHAYPLASATRAVALLLQNTWATSRRGTGGGGAQRLAQHNSGVSQSTSSCDNAVSLRQARAEWTKGIPVRGEQCYVRAAGTAWDSNGDLAYRHSDSGDYGGAYGLCRGASPGLPLYGTITGRTCLRLGASSWKRKVLRIMVIV